MVRVDEARVSSVVDAGHGLGDFDIFVSLGPDNNIVYEMPALGLRVHP